MSNARYVQFCHLHHHGHAYAVAMIVIP